jgi:hypothetical protein
MTRIIQPMLTDDSLFDAVEATLRSYDRPSRGVTGRLLEEWEDMEMFSRGSNQYTPINVREFADRLFEELSK